MSDGGKAAWSMARGWAFGKNASVNGGRSKSIVYLEDTVNAQICAFPQLRLQGCAAYIPAGEPFTHFDKPKTLKPIWLNILRRFRAFFLANFWPFLSSHLAALPPLFRLLRCYNASRNSPSPRHHMPKSLNDFGKYIVRPCNAV